MLSWDSIATNLISGHDLTEEQSYWFMNQVMTGELGDIRLASALTALRIKGLSVDEVRGCADAMRDHARTYDLPSDVLDIVGTGGDGHRSVNISTMSAVVLAASGVPVVKHGNRASTSASGAADVLEALGVCVDREAEDICRIFREHNIAFLFANKVHPSMRFAAPVRRTLAFPTIFNLLGPLTNPVRPQSMAIGCSDPRNAQLMAGVCAGRGISAVIFRGRNTGLDELSTADINEIWMISEGRITHHEIDVCATYGLSPSTIDDLRGGSAEHNAAVAREVFAGSGHPAIVDSVALNVAAGLLAYGRTEAVGTDNGDIIQRLGAGLEYAKAILASGKAAELITQWSQATQS
ncbi:anthranilate phosphoribosyltransferase [Schaalia sp. lx-260]|uniref:anthranilate phosphoribosyltransferase n=1 Tax=Schaalia sp. lx-260 TaxID=2899082 RepID=UPI001E5F7FC2|nr:anthranilate phosphoribosyltransferase [Schaalia sp. lx-260]MCD4549501.1 anthranilate phosphoribosyltransferase [Schaalia sp. lx-260]